jgi:multidrug efflux pump subunit AcrA (membrane-fusion protein)
MKFFVASSIVARRTAVGIAALTALFGAAMAAEPPAKGESQGVMVLVTKATNGCFSSLVRVDGILVARNQAQVTPDAEGFRITQINVREGDLVTSGQQLARLSRPGDTGAGTTLRAPAAGLVTKSTAVLGSFASAKADPLFTIAIDGDIEVLADVPSIYVPKLSTGQTARVELEDNRDMPGRVRTIPAEINPMSQLGQVRISIESDPSLHPGTFARVTIDAARSCGISVPRAAVLYRTEGTSVQVVRNRVVEMRRVQVGLQSGTSAEIRDGVKEGEMIVANAGGSLHDGEKVHPMFRDETTGQLEER